MAPSTRTRKPLSAKQQASAVASTKPLALGKVSKPAASTPKQVKVSESRIGACEQAIVEQEEAREKQLRERVSSRQRSSIKRKRNQSHLDDEDEGQSFTFDDRISSVKKSKIQLQLLTPPHSQNNTDTEGSSPVKKHKSSVQRSTTLTDLPEGFQHLASLHTAFIKAFSLHEAHNGLSAPAELGDFMFSMTRLWKKATVTRADLQRMLAIYEVTISDAAPSTILTRERSPFVMVTSGLGFNVRTNVEFCPDNQVNLSNLQSQYEQRLIEVFEMLRSVPNSFVHCPLSTYPLLDIRVGVQTQMRQQKMSSVRAEILSKSTSTQKTGSSELDFSKLSISDQMMDMTPTTVKSRTLSLFDRVRAKGVASSAAAAPTPAQLTRRHAIGRVPEIVEFFRMKQSQKSSNSSSLLTLEDLEDEHTSQSSRNSRGRNSRRVSFSLTQIIREVRESVTVPVSAEEVQVVITMLATEMPELGGWIKVFAKGCVVSVTLDGAGLAMSGKEVGQLIQEKEKCKL